MSFTTDPTILCAAFSARQIADSARRAGIGALAVDFFADLDCAQTAVAATVVKGDYPDGFSASDVMAALDEVAHGHEPMGFVYGAGFEDRPDVLAAIAARWPLLGTAVASQKLLKDPRRFADLCESAGVPHPEITYEAVDEPTGWLSKKIGGCGGSHVRPAERTGPSPDRYLQRIVEGERWSACFLAAGNQAVILGFTRQWTDPCADEPYRYGGAVGPLEPPPGSSGAMGSQISAIVAQCERLGAPIAGLGSADFVVNGGEPVLLEINARFGATVDIFDTPYEPLLRLHLAACDGRLPDLYVGPESIKASGLAWAHEATTLAADFNWPSYSRDRTRPPIMFAAGQPLCTIVAEGGDENEARAGFDAKVAQLKNSMERKVA